MTRLTLVTALTLAVLLICGSPSQIQASSDTRIVIQDGGSILLHADGLDAGKTWKYAAAEVRHRNSKGVLHTLQITEAGGDLCGGSAICGVDPAKPWTIQVTYGAGSVTIASVSSNKGVHLTHSGLPFDQWKRTANADEREFGHGDGQHITGIKVNNGANLCSGKGCIITVQYSPR
ncbi:MAG: hypothetical protein ABSE42_10525 [Bryobacteraceae bacterium]|jgi:hypothetical protein